MILPGDLKLRLGGFAVYTVVRHWMNTLDYQVLRHDPTVDPVRDDFQGPVICMFWHEYILAPFFLRAHCNIAMLLSRHRDAEWLAQAARLMGYDTVRGSTKRGGDVALRELFQKSRSMNLAMTPDGPRGPRRRLASGCIFAASKLGIPLVILGVGYDRPWRLGTWDRFAVPRPFSRVRIVIGPRIWIPPNLNRREIGRYRKRVEGISNQLTGEAERWAESGERRRGQECMLPQAASPHGRYREAATDASRATILPLHPEVRQIA
jgi:lysophospholipid acyltransferase (LPLAT)-like uncharacterized protein